MTVAAPPRRVLVAGAGGQVGRALVVAAPAGVEVLGLDRAALDVGDREQVARAVAELRPDLVINAAAYTAVDKAESDAAGAFRINRDGAAHLAEAAHRHGARLIHLSTDYVFDGTQPTPYRPDDRPNPLGVYGRSKLEGETAVAERTQGAGLVVRTAWVYAASGTNFVRTMLRLLPERDEVRVVSDQVGTPTSAATLAGALWQLAQRPDARGILHWTDAGVASWYDVAQRIAEEWRATRPNVRLGRVTPILTADYPTPARRPAYGVLDKTDSWRLLGPGVHWSVPLREVVRALVG